MYSGNMDDRKDSSGEDGCDRSSSEARREMLKLNTLANTTPIYGAAMAPLPPTKRTKKNEVKRQQLEAVVRRTAAEEAKTQGSMSGMDFPFFNNDARSVKEYARSTAPSVATLIGPSDQDLSGYPQSPYYPPIPGPPDPSGSPARNTIHQPSPSRLPRPGPQQSYHQNVPNPQNHLMVPFYRPSVREQSTPVSTPPQHYHQMHAPGYQPQVVQQVHRGNPFQQPQQAQAPQFLQTLTVPQQQQNLNSPVYRQQDAPPNPCRNAPQQQQPQNSYSPVYRQQDAPPNPYGNAQHQQQNLQPPYRRQDAPNPYGNAQQQQQQPPYQQQNSNNRSPPNPYGSFPQQQQQQNTYQQNVNPVPVQQQPSIPQYHQNLNANPPRPQQQSSSSPQYQQHVNPNVNVPQRQQGLNAYGALPLQQQPAIPLQQQPVFPLQQQQALPPPHQNMNPIQVMPQTQQQTLRSPQYQQNLNPALPVVQQQQQTLPVQYQQNLNPAPAVQHQNMNNQNTAPQSMVAPNLTTIPPQPQGSNPGYANNSRPNPPQPQLVSNPHHQQVPPQTAHNVNPQYQPPQHVTNPNSHAAAAPTPKVQQQQHRPQAVLQQVPHTNPAHEKSAKERMVFPRVVHRPGVFYPLARNVPSAPKSSNTETVGAACMEAAAWITKMYGLNA